MVEEASFFAILLLLLFFVLLLLYLYFSVLMGWVPLALSFSVPVLSLLCTMQRLSDWVKPRGKERRGSNEQ
jgi:hypothetical protein